MDNSLLERSHREVKVILPGEENIGQEASKLRDIKSDSKYLNNCHVEEGHINFEWSQVM